MSPPSRKILLFLSLVLVLVTVMGTLMYIVEDTKDRSTHCVP